MATNSAHEQLILELINRARLDPAAEAARLGIGLNEGLSAGTISSGAKQVLAANPLLVDAARDHSQWMLDRDKFQHEGAGGRSPTQRIEDANYTLSGSWATGENIAWVGTSGSLNLGSRSQFLHDNLFKSAGHRTNILNDSFREIGVGARVGEFEGLNSLMLTENFARSGSDFFVTGVVIDDGDGDEFYDIGEGRSGITVSVAGKGSDVTETAGGYKVAVSGSSHVVTFSGGDLSSAVSVTVVARSSNAKVDLVGSNKILSSADTTLEIGAINLSLLGAANIDGVGNEIDNIIRGNKGANTLDGLAGDDTIRGLGGKDIVGGGLGDDYLYGGAGNDVLQGRDGADRIYGGGGNDRANGGAHNDSLIGGGGGDTLRGGTGADRLLGGSGNDRLFGDNGQDFLRGGGGNDRLFGGRGDDKIDGDGGRDTVVYDGGSGRYDVDELSNGNIRVTDLRGGDGVDLLIDVEVLQFADGTLLF